MDSREVGHKLRQVLHLYGCFSVGNLLGLICVQLIVVVVLVFAFIAPVVVWLTHVGIRREDCCLCRGCLLPNCSSSSHCADKAAVLLSILLSRNAD